MLKIKVEFEGEVVSRIFRTFNFSFSTGRLLVEVDSAVSPMGDCSRVSTFIIFKLLSSSGGGLN